MVWGHKSTFQSVRSIPELKEPGLESFGSIGIVLGNSWKWWNSSGAWHLHCRRLGSRAAAGKTWWFGCFREDLVAAGVAIGQEEDGEEFDLILVWWSVGVDRSKRRGNRKGEKPKERGRGILVLAFWRW